MKVRFLLAPAVAALGMALANGQEPGRLAVADSNQQLADRVAATLMAGSAAKGADITIVAVNGTVTLGGTCKDDAQKKAIVDQVRTAKGVTLVKDGLATTTVVQAQAQDAPAALPPVGPRVSGPGFAVSQPAAPAAGPMIEPTPIGGAGFGSMDVNAPALPGYAWPTYAPHPNISRVAYPQSHAYGDFPFIGPYYPFPKVPMGWRAVTLKWEDGHWFLGRKSVPHDYWRVRFW